MLKALRSSTLKHREKNKEKINLQVIKKKKRSCSQSVPIQEKKKRLCSQSVPIQEKNKCLQIRSDTLFQEEIQRLYCLFSTVEGLPEEQDVVSSSSISSQFDTPASSPTPSLEVFGSGSSLAWDNQGDLQSPLKDTSDLFDHTFQFSDQDSTDSPPPALSKQRSVSVSVNRVSQVRDEPGQFFDFQPVCRSLNNQAVLSV